MSEQADEQPKKTELIGELGKKIMNGSQIYTRDRCANISEFSVGSGSKINYQNYLQF